MRYQAFVRAAAGALAVVLSGGGAVYAQVTQTQPLPHVMTDTAPLPASERQSSGAVILLDQPVLAQRRALAAVEARAPDTAALGAGPARVFECAQKQQQMRERHLRERSGALQ